MHNKLKLGIVSLNDAPNCDELENRLASREGARLVKSRQQYQVRKKSGEIPLNLDHHMHCLFPFMTDIKPSECSIF